MDTNNSYDIYQLFENIHPDKEMIDKLLDNYSSLDAESFEIFVCNKWYPSEEQMTTEDVQGLYPSYNIKYLGKASSFYANGEPVTQEFIESELWYDEWMYMLSIAETCSDTDALLEIAIKDDSGIVGEIQDNWRRWAEAYYNDLPQSPSEKKTLKETIVHIGTIMLPHGNININQDLKGADPSTIVNGINQFGDMMLHFKERQSRISLKKGISIITKKEFAVAKVYAIYDQNSGHLVKFELQLIENYHDDVDLTNEEVIGEVLQEESIHN